MSLDLSLAHTVHNEPDSVSNTPRRRWDQFVLVPQPSGMASVRISRSEGVGRAKLATRRISIYLYYFHNLAPLPFHQRSLDVLIPLVLQKSGDDTPPPRLTAPTELGRPPRFAGARETSKGESKGFPQTNRRRTGHLGQSIPCTMGVGR